MVMRIRTILGDPAVAARIEAALRERIAAARPEMPEALRDFLEDDDGSVRLALSLPLGLFHLHADPPPPGTQAAPPRPGHDGVATARCAVSVDALEDAPTI
ncbi:MAG: hypothetical protein MUE98_13790 [Rhodobacteraceae bacterium]|jgi:hypothetical protein|nr:hypothetical protein [Paracoccaceae bacterium]